MIGWMWSTRARLLPALTGVLFGLTGLASVNWESSSYAHGHRAGGGATHHHHLYLGAHDHAAPPADSGAPEAPDPGGHGDPERTPSTSFSVSPSLSQPVPAQAQALVAPRVDSTSLRALLSLPPRVRLLARPAGPRPPPSPWCCSNPGEAA